MGVKPAAPRGITVCRLTDQVRGSSSTGKTLIAFSTHDRNQLLNEPAKMAIPISV
jgi:hypothetical protein